jgi:hypothetical protein
MTTGLYSACAHQHATLSIGPTTDQRNHWCPDCRLAWTTFPTDAERAEALRDSFDRHMARRSQAHGATTVNPAPASGAAE